MHFKWIAIFLSSDTTGYPQSLYTFSRFYFKQQWIGTYEKKLYNIRIYALEFFALINKPLYLHHWLDETNDIPSWDSKLHDTPSWENPLY